jgi:DNA-binding NarL/FixJ family response regulator
MVTVNHHDSTCKQRGEDDGEHHAKGRGIEGVEGTVSAGSPISPVTARQLLKRFKLKRETNGQAPDLQGPAMTQRESEVLALVAKGFSFAEIAKLLQVSPHTVNAHVKKIYQKLAVHSRGEAVYEAGRMGLL